MEFNYNKTWQKFDVSEHDDEAIFPMRYIAGLPYIIVNKKNFKVFETENTYVLEALDHSELDQDNS